MSSVRTKLLTGVAAAAMLGTTAYAADLPPPTLYQPVPVSFGGWYLRGDIGMTNQRVKEMVDVQLFPGTQDLVIHDKSFDSGMLFGLGVGYQYNNWLRFDVTGEYRGRTDFTGLDTWFDGTDARFNTYTARKSEWLFLANAYVDLGTWWCITPFVGLGIGTSRNTISSYRDVGTGPGPGFVPALAFADSASKWNFAWAVHAGLSYQVTPGFTVELAYRYVNLGDGLTGDVRPYDGPGSIYNTMEFKDITSHDLKFGVRWALDAAPIGKQPVFAAPPPVYKSYQQTITVPQQPGYQEQPPLMRRG
jgi:opacity protein-like surface antigen